MNDRIGSVDWREFVVSLSMPAYLTTPTLSQLISMRDAGQRADGDKDGRLTFNEYMSVPFWFEASAIQQAAAATPAHVNDDSNNAVRALKTFYYR
jgi:hypothetical protein